MILDLTIITNFKGIDGLQTSCIVCAVESNIQIAKDIDDTLTNAGNISTRCSITIIPKEITISINFTYPDTITGGIIGLCSQSRSYIKFFEFIYCETGIQERITCLTILFNPGNGDCCSTNNCLTKGRINIVAANCISSFHRKVQTCTINNDISNLFRVVGGCKLSLECKVARCIDQRDERIIRIC